MVAILNIYYICLVECRSEIGLNVNLANGNKFIGISNAVRILKMYDLYNPPKTVV